MHWKNAESSINNLSRLLFDPNFNSLGTVGITKIICSQEMSSASPGARHRKPTRRTRRKAPTLRPQSNTSGTEGGRVVMHQSYLISFFNI